MKGGRPIVIEGDRIHVCYRDGESVIDLLNQARRIYGDEKQFFMVPASLWRRWKIEEIYGGGADG